MTFRLQTIDEVLEKLKNPELLNAVQQLRLSDAQTRYEAVCFLARYPKTNDYIEINDAVAELTEDLDKRVSWAAGIAGSMIMARNSQFLRSVPDFLKDWGDLEKIKAQWE